MVFLNLAQGIIKLSSKTSQNGTYFAVVQVIAIK
jgi:hypothetical protein